jgi:hypothetical protein
VLLAVELLSLLVDHDILAQQLCSHSGKEGWGRLVSAPAEGGQGWGRDRFRASRGLLQLVPQVAGEKGDSE